MPPEGLEHPSKTSEKTAALKQDGAESGARSTHSPTTCCIDSRLSHLIDVWPNLPEAIRTGITAMIAATKSIGNMKCMHGIS